VAHISNIFSHGLSTGWNSRWIGSWCISCSDTSDVELLALDSITTKLTLSSNPPALVCFSGQGLQFCGNNSAADAFCFGDATVATTALGQIHNK
jgi:hypothetical protein